MQNEVKLSTLLQLSLGNPEPGAVNFNFLHALLEAILQHLDISNLSVSADALSPQSPVEVVGTTETPGPVIADEVGISFQSVAPSVYQSLESRLSKVEKQLTNLDSLPGNTDLLDFVFSGQPKDVLAEKEKRKMTELWQTVQTKRRLDSLEGGLGKVCGVVDELLTGMRKMENSHAKFQEALGTLERQGGMLEELKPFAKQLENLSSVQTQILTKLKKAVSVDALKGVVTWPSLKAVISSNESAQSPVQPDQKPSDGEVPDLVSNLPSSITKCEDDDLKTWLSQLFNLKSNLGDLQQRILKLEEDIKNAATLEDLGEVKVPEEIFKTIEELQAQVKQLLEEKQKVLIERGSDPVDIPDPLVQDKLRELETFTSGLDEQVKRLRSGLEKVRGGLSDQQHKTEVLKAEVEDLDQQKASITYVDEALSKKLDSHDLDSKLDRALFDQTTEGIRRIIEGLLEKLLGLETELKGMIDELSGNVLSKAEKDELDELRKWLEKKLASLPVRARRASKKQHMDECCQPGYLRGDGAAGLRRKIVSHFHCISCDRPLELEVPKVDVPALPELRSFRQGRSPRPLAPTDLARARRRRHLSELRAFYLDPPYVDLGISYYDAYRSPRQCGGQHTTTSPESRLRRAQMALGMAYDEDELDELPGFAAIENGASSQERPPKLTITLPPLDGMRPRSAGGATHTVSTGRQTQRNSVDRKTKGLRFTAMTKESDLLAFPIGPEPSVVLDRDGSPTTTADDQNERETQKSGEVAGRLAVTPPSSAVAIIRHSPDDLSHAEEVKLTDMEAVPVENEHEGSVKSDHMSDDPPPDPVEGEDP
ncbi:Glutamine-rich protein 2 [Sparganum proliferum]